MTIESALKKYILNECMYEEDESLLSDNDELLERGIIDSMKLMQLIQFMEEEFNVSINEEDLSRENFETISRLRELIVRKQHGQ